jgi:hypothetical protein
MHVHVFNFIRLAQILDHISLQYAPITNERKMQTKRTNASHERYEKSTYVHTLFSYRFSGF